MIKSIKFTKFTESTGLRARPSSSPVKNPQPFKFFKSFKPFNSIKLFRSGNRMLNPFKTFTGEFVFDLHLKFYGFSSRTLDIKSGTIRYFEKRVPNERGVLVFLHGIGASAGHYNHLMVLAQKSGYSVFAPDMPSHGSSSDLNTTLTAEAFYRSFVEWSNRVLPENFVLIGNSLGGGVSLKFALEYPHRLKHLIIASPAGGFETPEEWNRFKGSVIIRTIWDSRKFLNKLFHRNPFYLPIIYFPFLNAMRRKGILELLENTTFEDTQVSNVIPEKFPPTLLIWGKSERLFPSKNLSWFRAFFANQAVIEEPEGVGHCPHMDNPKWFHQRIVEFITGR